MDWDNFDPRRRGFLDQFWNLNPTVRLSHGSRGKRDFVLFIEDVARAVEERHYPNVRANAPLSFADQISETARFFGVLVLANMAALVLALIFVPFAPFIYWGVNGYLLGREYFMLVALRHLSRPEAHQLLQQKSGVIWMAGILMVMPMSIPLLNLAIPVLGAATFTHLIHRF